MVVVMKVPKSRSTLIVSQIQLLELFHGHATSAVEPPTEPAV